MTSIVSYGSAPCASTLPQAWHTSTRSTNNSDRVEVASSLPNAAWRKSHRSGGQSGDCVEVAHNLVPTLGLVAVSDWKDPDGPALTVAPDAWSAFFRRLLGAVRP